ncbi:MAG: hypothetical protein HY276_10910 [Ignavibacteriales bacterium]|nr:hypothetical protein [Ignavibacteriales bacterium]
MQEISIIFSKSEIAQKNADPESAILGRVYSLILTWSRQAETATGRSAEENAYESGTACDGQQTEGPKVAL